MIDVDNNEVDALLALVQWWEQSDGAAWDRSKDADIRAAARKLARPAPASQKVDAARKAKENVIYEKTLLLSWITYLVRRRTVHLVESEDAGRMPYVVCIHIAGLALTWRVTADEAENIFGHLRRDRKCSQERVGHDEKIAHLAALLVDQADL